MDCPKKTEARAKRAIKATSTNWLAITACVCFTIIMCVKASNLKDGSEAETAFYGIISTFFIGFMGYLFTGQKE